MSPSKVDNYTEEHLVEQYRRKHQEDKQYGKSSHLLQTEVQEFVDFLKPSRILDYGCGKSNLLDLLTTNAERHKYDPALPEHSSRPEGVFDLVLNTDVLEHIPEHLLDGLLSDISTIGRNAVFCICLVKAKHFLPDGSNCHCTVKSPEWWLDRISNYFPDARIDKIIRDRQAVITTWKI